MGGVWVFGICCFYNYWGLNSVFGTQRESLYTH